MVVAHQLPQHGQVDTGLGERGAEGVPQRMRMALWHTGFHPVVTEDRAQPAGVSGRPRCGPLVTTNSAVAVVSGRSTSR